MKRRSVSTKRLQIRPLKVSDYDAWYSANVQSLRSQSAFDRGPVPVKKATRRQFVQKIKRYEMSAKSDSVYVWGVFQKKTRELVGLLDISVISRGPIQKANLGYRVFNLHWRRGYAREFVKIGILLGLKDLKLNRLEAVIDPDNIASVKLARSVGMENEGIRRNYYYQGGKWADQVVYSAYRKKYRLPSLRI